MGSHQKGTHQPSGIDHPKGKVEGVIVINGWGWHCWGSWALSSPTPPQKDPPRSKQGGVPNLNQDKVWPHPGQESSPPIIHLDRLIITSIPVSQSTHSRTCIGQGDQVGGEGSLSDIWVPGSSRPPPSSIWDPDEATAL
ncbi:hypothetical protein DSO57_1026207 [Entomophthora muscae]|uniref:Uncharacterized protein n=1 Tax=Entomophthora muscae TaxID=34485 RepID=A0ACC2T2D1_9FUNG|nr:hypothetical protein DSO57_1026207 [Entomophthora muscae]